MRTTHAIEVDVRDPSEINEIFDSISYAKGVRTRERCRGDSQR